MVSLRYCGDILSNLCFQQICQLNDFVLFTEQTVQLSSEIKKLLNFIRFRLFIDCSPRLETLAHIDFGCINM